MEPRQARVRAGITAAEIICPQFIPASDISGFAKNGSGRPLGISPIISLSSKSKRRETSVITIRATKVDGTFLVTSGKSSIINIVPKPSRSAVTEMPEATVAGKFATISTTSTGDLLPMIGYICCRIMITPIPLIKPERTGYGIYLTYLPILINPKAI